MSGELKLWNVMFVIILGVWLGAVISIGMSGIRSGKPLSASSEGVSKLPTSSLITMAVVALPTPIDSPAAAGCAGLTAPTGESAECAPCPSGQIIVLVATGLSGRQPVIPEAGPRSCVTAGPLPGGLVAAGGWCYSVNESLFCKNVLDKKGGRWACPAAAGAIPAWRDPTPAWPSSCIPNVGPAE